MEAIQQFFTPISTWLRPQPRGEEPFSPESLSHSHLCISPSSILAMTISLLPSFSPF
jgi:hypothetical protein